MAGTSVTKVWEAQALGGVFQAWTCLLDPAEIAGAAQGIETVEIPGARSGDIVFAQPEAVETHVIPAGAKVTGDDEVSLYINNAHTSSAKDGAEKQWNILIFKLAGGDVLAAA